MFLPALPSLLELFTPVFRLLPPLGYPTIADVVDVSGVRVASLTRPLWLHAHGTLQPVMAFACVLARARARHLWHRGPCSSGCAARARTLFLRAVRPEVAA